MIFVGMSFSFSVKMHRQMEFICIPLAGNSLTTAVQFQSTIPYAAPASDLGIILSYDDGEAFSRKVD